MGRLNTAIIFDEQTLERYITDVEIYGNDYDDYDGNDGMITIFYDDRFMCVIDDGREINSVIDLRFHRVGGPAYWHPFSGTIEWWVEDTFYQFVEDYCDGCGFSEEDKVLWVLKYGKLLPENINDL